MQQQRGSRAGSPQLLSPPYLTPLHAPAPAQDPLPHPDSSYSTVTIEAIKPISAAPSPTGPVVGAAAAPSPASAQVPPLPQPVAELRVAVPPTAMAAVGPDSPMLGLVASAPQQDQQISVADVVAPVAAALVSVPAAIMAAGVAHPKDHGASSPNLPAELSDSQRSAPRPLPASNTQGEPQLKQGEQHLKGEQQLEQQPATSSPGLPLPAPPLPDPSSISASSTSASPPNAPPDSSSAAADPLPHHYGVPSGMHGGQPVLPSAALHTPVAPSVAHYPAEGPSHSGNNVSSGSSLVQSVSFKQGMIDSIDVPSQQLPWEAETSIESRSDYNR